MNRATRKRISPEVQFRYSRNEETLTTMLQRAVDRGLRVCPVHGQENARTVSLSSSLSEKQSRTVIKEERNRANM